MQCKVHARFFDSKKISARILILLKRRLFVGMTSTSYLPDDPLSRFQELQSALKAELRCW